MNHKYQFHLCLLPLQFEDVMPVQNVTVMWRLFIAVSGTAHHPTMHTQVTPLAIWSDKEIWTWLGIDDKRQEEIELEIKMNAMKEKSTELQMEIDEMRKQTAQFAGQLLLFGKKKEKLAKDIRLSGFQKKEKGKRWTILSWI